MIDNFVLALTHGLMMLAAWRLLSRPDLDDDSVPPPDPAAPRAGWARPKAEADAPRA
jgi:hypothetical protein